MSTSLKVFMRGGNLTTLVKRGYAPLIETLYVKRGYINPYEYMRFYEGGDDKEIVFPKLHTLLLDNPDTHYLYYNTSYPHFPHIRNLYLRNARYDADALRGMALNNPTLGNIYYAVWNHIDAERYERYAENTKEPKVTEITDEEFEDIGDKLLGSGFLALDD